MAKSTPLVEIHRAHGAELVEESGWILASHFGARLEEYEAVRSRVGLLDLCHYAALHLTGPDRVSYLQGMVTNDVKTLAPGAGLYAAILDVTGKILADLRVLCTEASFMLVLWEPLKQKVVTHLNRYLVADDVEIGDSNGRYGMLSIQGPKARPLLRQLAPAEELPPRMHGHRLLRIGEREVRVIRSTHTGEEGFDLLMEIGCLAPVVGQLEKAGAAFSLRWVGLRAQEILRVEAGLPRYGIDMDEENLILETALEQAISFQKGCYLGQEVVERIRSRGHVNRRLVGMALEGERAVIRGDKVKSGDKEIGRVTSSVVSPALKRPIALSYAHRDYWQPGTKISVERNGDLVAGAIAPLPFYTPSP